MRRVERRFARRTAAEPSRRPLLVAALVLAGLPAARAMAQDGGLFVPVATPSGELPANLGVSDIIYSFDFITDLPPTDENLRKVTEQRLRMYVAWESGTSAVECPKREAGSAGAVPCPEISPAVNVDPDWPNSVRCSAAELIGHLRADPASKFSTQDGSLTVARGGDDVVEFIVRLFTAGRRFEYDPEIAPLLQEIGKRFEPWEGGKPEPQRMYVADPKGGPATITEFQLAGRVRLQLTEAEAMTYLARLENMPREFGAELRLTSPRITLGFATRSEGNFGPALSIRQLRITGKPAEGTESLTIPLRRIEVAYVRMKPDLKRFAELLNGEAQDPEILDRWSRCPPSVKIVSQFSRLPDGAAIRSGEFAATNDVLMHTRGAFLTDLYEDSLDAAVNPGKVAFRGVTNSPLGIDNLLIGHYYYVFDSRGVTETPANPGSFKVSVGVTRSSYANTMRSSTHSSAQEVTVSAKGGLKDVWEVGGEAKFSWAHESTTGSESGSSEENAKTVEIEITRQLAAGAVTVVEFPVFLNGRRRGTSRFTFGVDEKVSYGVSARIQQYRPDKKTGVLRMVVAGTDEDDATRTSFSLGEELSGVDLNVVRVVFPGLAANSKACVLAGRWRATDLSNGEIRYVTVDAKGVLKEHGDENPSRRIDVDPARKKAKVTSLDDESTEEFAFAFMTSRTTPSLGPTSKVAFTKDGRPVAFWIRAGGDGAP